MDRFAIVHLIRGDGMEKSFLYVFMFLGIFVFVAFGSFHFSFGFSSEFRGFDLRD